MAGFLAIQITSPHWFCFDRDGNWMWRTIVNNHLKIFYLHLSQDLHTHHQHMACVGGFYICSFQTIQLCTKLHGSPWPWVARPAGWRYNKGCETWLGNLYKIAANRILAAQCNYFPGSVIVPWKMLISHLIEMLSYGRGSINKGFMCVCHAVIHDLSDDLPLHASSSINLIFKMSTVMSSFQKRKQQAIWPWRIPCLDVFLKWTAQRHGWKAGGCHQQWKILTLIQCEPPTSHNLLMKTKNGNVNSLFTSSKAFHAI